MEKVSVVIPTYKRAETISRAVESVLNQTFKDVAVIVVDDNGIGTPEQLRTESILGRHIKDRALCYIAQPTNMGANAARNTGVRMARGQYVAFLDDDDEWLNTKLERQVTLIESDQRIGVVYTKVVIRYDDLKIQYTTHPRARGYIHDDLLIENCVGAMASVLIRRQALLENPFDEKLPARQDYDLWLRISKTWTFEVIDDVLAVVHAKNSKSRITADVNNYVNAVEIIEQKYIDEISVLAPAVRARRRSEQFYFLGAQSIKANRSDLARAYFAKSLRAKASTKTAFALISSFFGTKATVYARALQAALRK